MEFVSKNMRFVSADKEKMTEIDNWFSKKENVTENSHLNEECGLFGIWGHPDAAKLTYFGLHALQHRGQEGAGILTNDAGSFHRYRGLGLVTEVFRDEKDLSVLTGNAGIGHVRYATAGSA